MEGCCCKCNKYILFLFNFIFALSVPSIVLILTGSVIFVIAFFGCFGAIRESTCLLYAYSTFLALILALLIAGTVLAFLWVSKADEVIHDALVNLLDDESATEAWNKIHTRFECCGVDGSSDWNGTVPDSCVCNSDTDPSLCDSSNYYIQGCYDPIYHFFKTLELTIAGLALAFAFVALCGVFLSCMLAGAIKTKAMHI
ncbi:hypothetical protein B566_EDAN005021 [Ephemera danica]|nr:hypothetical protein B566_EDAN005021 [Ephemera danica]